MSDVEIISALNQLDFWPIEKELTEQEINKKWRLLMKYYHPDVNDTAVFKDGEKAKKVNAAHDFLIQNLEAVNEYIRKTLNGETNQSNTSRQENYEENSRRAQQEAYDDDPEFAARAAEARRRAQQARKEAEEETIYSEYDRKSQASSSQRQQSYSSSYSSNDNYSYNSSSTTSSSSSSTNYYNTSSTSTSPTYSTEVRKESTFNKIWMFSILGIGFIALIISMVGSIKNNIMLDDTPLFVYSLFMYIPIVIFTVIPKTRKQLFSTILNAFLLFAEVIMMLASLGL